MTQFKHIRMIINPAAGKEQSILRTANTVFQQLGIKWDVRLTNKHGDGERLAREAENDRAIDLIAVYGGDGTVGDVANGLIGAETPLMVLSGGTANGIATEIGFPENLNEALAQIPHSSVHTIDAGKHEDRYFFHRIDMGFSAEVLDETPREMKDRYGMLAYGLTILQKSTQPPSKYRVTIDGEVHEAEGIGCVVSNCNTVGLLNLTIKKAVRFDDGLLDVIVLETFGGSLLGAAKEIIDLEDSAAASMLHWQGREIYVETEPVTKLRGDGEFLGDSPSKVTIAPKVLKVLVPNPT